MSGFSKWAKRRLRAERFHPSLIGMVINPFYLMRRGLWANVRDLAPSVTGNLLDLGCGSKPYVELFDHAASYLGMDIQVSGHDHANSLVDVYYDGKVIPFEAGKFDAVLSFETFEHIFNLNAVLAEINRVIADGGHLLFTVPFTWQEHEEPYDFARYTSYGMADILHWSGFSVVEMRKSGNYVEAVFQAFIGYLFSQFAPKQSLVARVLFCSIFIFPFTLLGRIAAAVLPKRYDCFCNLVVLAQKKNSDGEPLITPVVDPRNSRPIDR